ncbi:tRNA ligase 1-like isoform X3 [Papaver somniferum]|uniref:tRNA ligase 1-like isoform X3 n=1 Tax=Papaver somniferum TaxID=3469 RepID=UPI000E6FCA01|nr:tRNA ligase 1-like isoform X3 [Papaver somniferum]
MSLTSHRNFLSIYNILNFSSSFSSPKPKNFFLLHPSHKFQSSSYISLRPRTFGLTDSISELTMPNRKGKTGDKRGHQVWKESSKYGDSSLVADSVGSANSAADQGKNNKLTGLSIGELKKRVQNVASTVQFGSVPSIQQAHVQNIASPLQFGSVPSKEPSPVQGEKTVWKPKQYGTVSGPTNFIVGAGNPDITVTSINNINDQNDGAASAEKKSAGSSKVVRGSLAEDFVTDKYSYSNAKIRATFYPKFENEKSDQEVRTRMIEMVSKGLASLEVSLKHSGSLFMYAGHEGGACAKNSFGNIYTAVGVFVLGRMFREAWGTEAFKKQAEFNIFLERNHMCISMELVTAVLGDHGQRPLEDYVVVTAVTEFGNGKPKFYSTPEIIAFCRKWRLTTNHVWLFSTRKSVSSFFAAYDALCEEGTATPVCKALDEVADISVPASKDHVQVQGEILEGLVARMVSHESSKHMEKVLKEFPLPSEGVTHDLGPSLRKICADNRSDEKQQIKALLHSVGSSFCPDLVDWFGDGSSDAHLRNADRSVVSKFLQAAPTDYATTKLQEVVRLISEKRFPAALKCYCNFHKITSLAANNVHFKMVIHVYRDSAFRQYQKEMRRNPGLWPLYRGFFVDINLFKVSKDKAVEGNNVQSKNANGSSETSTSGADGLADEDANLMVKLKFLTYKIRTFLIRNGLSILFKDGPAAYRTYYMRQMKIWGTSSQKQKELSKMLDEWASYIRRKCGNKQLSSSIYLTEAEPFLEQYARRSPQNQILIGSAGNLVRSDDFLAVVESGRDEEGDLETERNATTSSPTRTVMDSVRKDEGLIVFFPGIPGCAKSALCKEILNTSGGLGDDRPVHSLMGDLIKGKYWQMVANERRKKPYTITLADKNAPNEEVWRQIEDMCRSTRASAVPVVPDSEGTDSNPFTLDALAVFIFRVLQRENHPGLLDKTSPCVGYVLLMFYHLYDGKNRGEFESELIERFGTLVKIPLLKPDRSPLPDPVKSILEEGICLFELHRNKHGRLESGKGSYKKDWANWEIRLRQVVLANADSLNAIQVPFDCVVKQVLEQLKAVAKGESRTPTIGKPRLRTTIIFAAVTLPVAEIRTFLNGLCEKDPRIKGFLQDKDLLSCVTKAHVTLAHRGSHGIAAVTNYSMYLKRDLPVDLTSLLFSEKSAALEACLGSVDGEKISSKNEWPHVTIWTAPGVSPKEANTLPQLVSEGKAIRISINPPFNISGTLDFY